MSISSTGLYGSATIVNTDIFDDVQTLKEEIHTYIHTYAYIYLYICVYIYTYNIESSWAS